VLASGVGEAAMVADISFDAALEAAALCCATEVASSLDELLRGGLDGLVIATPTALHADQTVAALEAGLAVFCQKPLARSAREASEIVESARRANRLLGVDFSHRHIAGVQFAKQLIDAGELGEVFAIESVFHNAYGPDKRWYSDARLAGGGCLMDLGVHLADLALWLLDFPEVTAASGRLLRRGRPYKAGCDRGVEDYAVARVELATTATVSLTCSWHLPAGQPAVIRLACYGSLGGVLVENIEGSLHDFHAWLLRGTERRLLAGPPDDWTGRAIVAWAEQLRAGRGFSEDSWQHVRVADVLDRIYAS
jgi:predicted dehydrogenase